MLHYIKSEFLKQKHSFNKILLWLAPLLTILLAFVIMGRNNIQNGAYNWWYTIMLPGCFTMFSAFTAAKERKKNRHGLFGIAICKSKLWIAQIILNTAFLFITCFIFFAGIAVSGILFGNSIDVMNSLGASLILFITFAWQVPLWMFVTEKIGALFTILLSFICNFGIAVICAVESYWWVPFSIPARLMCPIIKVLPNGLWIETDSVLGKFSVVIPGIMITLALFCILTYLTSLWFQKREV
ncbi:MAG: lantibiotic immunity ABC transporter MutE/EpiE family permease subunit [Lachnospiraceae bacterium]